MVQDACSAGHAEAGQWSVSALTFMGDAIMTDAASFAAALLRRTAIVPSRNCFLSRPEPIICDGLRSCASPHCDSVRDFAGFSSYPSIAVLSINLWIDTMTGRW
jgi:hypothetical protein